MLVPVLVNNLCECVCVCVCICCFVGFTAIIKKAKLPVISGYFMTWYIILMNHGTLARSGRENGKVSIYSYSLCKYAMKCTTQKDTVPQLQSYLHDVLRQQENRTTKLSRNTDYVCSIQPLFIVYHHNNKNSQPASSLVVYPVLVMCRVN